MNCTRSITNPTLLSRQSATHILKTFHGRGLTTAASRPTFIATQTQWQVSQRRSTPSSQRHFSKSSNLMIKEFFPEPDAPSIKTTETAWRHPVYTEEQMSQVIVAHRNARTFSDKFALSLVRVMRWFMDRATGYVHKDAKELAAMDSDAARRKYQMTERKYLIRNIFLESIAGVPGMVAGMLRHLHSMRRMKRDNGWIETLLEESYNERMHLLTFMKICEPGWFMRFMVLGAQGVYFNAMFVSYLISPRTFHRFVGYLEEEAVLTYTRQIEDIDAGNLPMWAKMQAPDIAIQYWQMPEGHRTMRDLLLYIRADESKHREVNHTLGNLDQKNDPNPFTSKYRDETKPHPAKDMSHPRPTGWEREEVL